MIPETITHNGEKYQSMEMNPEMAEMTELVDKSISRDIEDIYEPNQTFKD